MNTKGESSQRKSLRRFLTERTRLPDIVYSLFDESSAGMIAWAKTTAGIVVTLLAVQVVTGALMAFYYVPSAEAAHTSIAYIEKVLPAGSWIRAVHHYGSQWLTLFLVLHLTQMFWRASYRRRPVAWLATIFLLALVLAGGVTGYSLPWDARAMFGTRVAQGIAAGIPLVGGVMHRWLVGGIEISTMTLSRFFGLHVLVVPTVVLVVIVVRLFVFREPSSIQVTKNRTCGTWQFHQLIRQSVAAGLIFLALALYAMKYHAPLGPSASDIAAGYMPRPGAQFLWLFQMLKYLPGRIASIVAVLVPTLIFVGLVLLPFLDARQKHKHPTELPRRRLTVVLFACGGIFVASMTAMAYINDARDPNVRAQLAQQAAEETAFRAEPFEPLPPRSAEANAPPSNATNAGPTKVVSADTPPATFLKRCASCHGSRGQGVKPFPKLLGVSAKPRRTVEDIIGLLNDPNAFGLEPPMRSFATKLTDDEKREIAEWLMLLKKP